jgi:hypothetical protein
VIEGQMGNAYVDDVRHPSAYKIQTGPFFYLAGDPLGEGGQEMLRNIQPWTLFMPSAEGWLEAGKSMYGEQLIGFDRYSFSAECLSLDHLKRLSSMSEFGSTVKQMDLAFVNQVWGQDHFVDLSDFESPVDFMERGIGYYVDRKGEILGAAYSSLVCSKGIEVSIFVSEDHRRRGMATVLAANLAGWCLEHNLDPHWDAANLESCRLAEKLGYLPKGAYRAHYRKD